MDGTGFALESFFAFSTNEVGAPLTSGQTELKTLIDQLPDIGQLIDDSLAGAIKLLPLQIKLPPTGKIKLGRIDHQIIKTKGMCLGTMSTLAGIPDGVKKMLHYFDAANSVVGGDVCAKLAEITVDPTNGLSTKVR